MTDINSPAYLNANVGGPILKVVIAFMVLQTFFIMVHIVARVLKKSSNGPETWFVLAGYFFNMAFDTTGVLQLTGSGLGKHVIALLMQSPETLLRALKILVPLNYSYLFAVTLPKLGVLCIYLRIFQMYHCTRIIYLLGIILIVNLIAWVLVISLICRPFAFNWDRSIHEGYCANAILAYEISGFPNIITDMVILTMPLPHILKLRASKARKIGLIITFWTGSAGLVSAIIRTYQFFDSSMFADITYNSVKPLAWSVVEGAAYQMAATFLTLGPLLQDIRRKTSSIGSRSRAQTPKRANSDGDGAVLQVIGGQGGRATIRSSRVLSYIIDPTNQPPLSTNRDNKTDPTSLEAYPVNWPLVTIPDETHRANREEFQVLNDEESWTWQRRERRASPLINYSHRAAL